MKAVGTLFAGLLAAVLVAGCKSSPVSRTYDGTYDQVWQAALSAAKDVTGRDPSYADKQSGKIITAWTQSNVAVQEGAPGGEKRSVDVWRGIVNVTKDIAGTKVTVRVDKGNYASARPATENSPEDASVTVALWTSDKDPQKTYLSVVTEELIKIKYRNKR